jgi:hypothetical protein
MLLAREEPILRPGRADENSLKYDLYLTRGPAGAVAWGATVNDRWEGQALQVEVAGLAGAWGVDLEPYARLRDALAGAGPALTVAVGFDDPARRPRLKLYLQEDVWGRGVATAGALRSLLPSLVAGCELPAWIPRERPVGVLTVVLRGDGTAGLKAYLGGPGAPDAAAGAPDEVLALASRFEALCPLPRSWHYLTVRMDPGRPPRYAINKIYNHVQVGFEGEPGLLQRAWNEVDALFAASGRPPASELRGDGADGVRVVPTASAWEAGARSADVYCGSWAVEPAADGGDRL